MAVDTSTILLLLLFISVFVAPPTIAHQEKLHKGQPVTYDAKSLIINGKRELLFSGSIHYPRSTPDMWPKLLEDAKRGGLNVIQTYTFWNIHEPEEGKFNFEGRFDVIKFVKLIGEHGLYATIRFGPFVQGEWNHGALPYWLREVPDIIFRSYNDPYRQHMERFVRMMVEKLREANLFAEQGGPIILAQIENEYNTVQLAYRELGNKYVQWAGNFAIGLNVGVPWVMCKQRDAPGPVINACNGRQCGDTFGGPNMPNKPALWTENWTAQFRVFGDPPSQRSVEDIAFSVARWFSKNGSLVNYYMYHGGTNLARTAASFVTTRYYDEAPIDEFGLERGPKYGHLKDVHKAINLCKRALLWGNPSAQRLNPDVEVRIYEQPGTDACAAFLTNNHTRLGHTANFKGKNYYLPPRSISILPDCKTLVLNTATIVAQHNSRNFVRSQVTNKLDWKMITETVATDLKETAATPMELYYLTKDKTDYGWYTTTITLDPRDLSNRKDILPVLRVASLGHAMLAFVNGQFIGSAHGSQIDKSFVLQKSAALKPGVNKISLLGTLVGLPDSGAYMEHRFAGPRGISILGMNTGTLDLSKNGWGHQAGLNGEHDQLFTEAGSRRVKWTQIQKKGRAVTWYKTSFYAPEGRNPVVVRMTGMGKGMVWINGNSIGRYWMSYLSPLGQPTQSEYHIPRSFMKRRLNLMVILEEEEKANPEKIEILTVNRDTICSDIAEDHIPTVKSWARQQGKILKIVDMVHPAAQLRCPFHKKIVSIDFASFGDPSGTCGSYAEGNCSSPLSKSVVEKLCIGKNGCDIPAERKLFDGFQDQCAQMQKRLAVQVKCGK
ncbi:Beta-galactosidase 14 [Linum perenne]